MVYFMGTWLKFLFVLVLNLDILIMTRVRLHPLVHRNLNLGNLYIVPRMKFVPMPHNPKPVAVFSHYEVNFSDWGYPRRVIQSLKTCDDPWLVPGFMIYPGAQGQLSRFVVSLFLFPIECFNLY